MTTKRKRKGPLEKSGEKPHFIVTQKKEVNVIDLELVNKPELNDWSYLSFCSFPLSFVLSDELMSAAARLVSTLFL